MPRKLPEHLTKQLDEMSCEAAFATSTRNKRDAEGEIILDRAGNPLQVTIVTAHISLKSKPDHPWVYAEGGDEDSALEKAIAKAKNSDRRPAETNQDTINENSRLKEELASKEAEVQRLKNDNIRARTDGSQVRRSTTVEPEAKSDPAPKAEAPASGSKGRTAPALS